MKSFPLIPLIRLWIVLFPSFVFAQDFDLAWQQVHFYSAGSVGIQVIDLDADGQQEVVFDDVQRFFICRYTGTQLQPLFISPYYDLEKIKAIHCLNIDADSLPEILVLLNTGLLEAYDGSDFRLLRRWDIHLKEPNLARFGDVDGDGHPECVAASDATLMAFDLVSGDEDWRESLDASIGDIEIGEVDGDSSPEVVVCTKNQWEDMRNGYVLNGQTGGTEWKYLTSFGNDIALGDASGDGRADILALYYDKVIVLDAQLQSPLWEVPDVQGGHIMFADVDQDSKPEILVISQTWSANIYCIDPATRTVKWSSNFIPSYGTHFTLGDPDADGVTELLWGSYESPNQVLVADLITRKVEYQSSRRIGVNIPVPVLDSTGLRRLLVGRNNYGHRYFNAYSLQSAQDSVWAWPLDATFQQLNLDGLYPTRLRDSSQNELLFQYGSSIYVYDALTRQHLTVLRQPMGLYDAEYTCVETANLEGDNGAPNLVLADEYGYLTVWGYDKGAFKVLWRSTDLGGRIIALQVANVDTDAALEILTLHQEGIVQCYDGITKLLQWQTGPFPYSSDLAVGNTDGQGSKEILLSQGKNLVVLDSKTRQIISDLMVSDQDIKHLLAANLDSTQADEIVILSNRLRLLEGGNYTSLYTSDPLVISNYYETTNLRLTFDFDERRPTLLVGTYFNAFAYTLRHPLPDRTAPRVVQHTPSANARYYPTDAPLSIRFSEKISEFSLNTQNIILKDKKGNVVPFGFHFDEASNTLYCHPASAWPSADTLALLLTGSLTDTAFNGFDGNGNNLSEGEPSDNYRFTFTTGTGTDQQGPQVLDAQLTPDEIWAGVPLRLNALFSDLSQVATSHIRAAEYFLDQPGTDGTGKALAPLSTWGNVEAAGTATLLTEGWAAGSRSVFVHAQDRFGNWGPFTPVTVQVKTDAPDIWPMYGQNALHTNANPAATLAPPFKLKWKKSFPSSISLHEPIYANGSILCTTKDNSTVAGTLHCFDTLMGSLRWSTGLGQGSPYISPAAAAYGMAFVQINNTSGNTFVQAFDLQTGSLHWSSPASSNWGKSLGATISEGKLYFNGGYFGGMYSLDAFTGNPLWFANLNDYQEWTPAIFEDKAYAFLNDYLSVHQAHTGEQLWKLDLPNAYNSYRIGTAPVIDTANRIVFVTSGTHLHAIHTDTRQLLWSALGTLGKTPALQAGKLYIIRNGTLEARNATTGQLLWKMAGNPALTYPPVIAGSFIYVSSANRTYALSLTNGQKVWEYAAGGALCMSDRLMLIADLTGKTLHVLERSLSADTEAQATNQAVQVYPNPCTDQATLRFDLPETASVTLQVFDTQGRCTATLLDTEMSAGEHSVVWETKDMPSGFYTYTLQIAGQVVSGQIVVARPR